MSEKNWTYGRGSADPSGPSVTAALTQPDAQPDAQPFEPTIVTGVATSVAPRVVPAAAPRFAPSVAPSVIVVGAGVSGCACAATLAGAGLSVTLLNSAMDRVGLPAYGPDIIGEPAGWERLIAAMSALPAPLSAIWLEAGATPAGSEGVLNIDRRRISVETKRLLEGLPGLEFRQGFVVDVRAVSTTDGRRQAQVETIFGEVFQADAVVVAVGLSIGGRSSVGGEVVEGGRYGEPASDELGRALEALGAQFRDITLEVGPRTAVDQTPETPTVPAVSGKSGGFSVVEQDLERIAEEGSEYAWPGDYPPAPHLDDSLRFLKMRMTPVAGSGRRGADRVAWVPGVSPDGAATAELYVAPGCVEECWRSSDGEGTGALVTRMPLTVTAKVVVELTDAGRLPRRNGDDSAAACEPVWIVGRSAGAEDYLASLLSGVRGGLDVASVIEGRQHHG